MFEEVLKEITPSVEEEKKLKETASWICSLVEEKANEFGFEAKARLVGSSARGTWISGERDIDVFILLPKHLNRQGLQKKGLKLAKGVASEGRSFVEDFAEHPYITAVFDEFKVDLVPAFDVDNAEEAASAVDRTPLHDDYVSSQLNDELRKNIRLLKKFMKQINVYGAELRIKGFSGYLNELLILNEEKNDNNKNKEQRNGELNAFWGVLERARNWNKGEVIDLENYGTGEKFDSPLIVIDPVDADRNVAAALETEQWAKFIGASQFFVKNSPKTFFRKKQEKEINLNDVKEEFKERGTQLVGISFDELDLVDDTLFPQLYKTEEWLKNVLEQNKFEVIRSGVYSAPKDYLVFLEVLYNLPSVKKHIGPPVVAEEHSSNFLKKYLDKSSELFSGPFIEDDRWVIEKKRKTNSAYDLIKKKLKKNNQTGIGKNLKETNKRVLCKDKLFREKYLEFFKEYLNKKEKWL